jgi:hypothetical protein
MEKKIQNHMIFEFWISLFDQFLPIKKKSDNSRLCLQIYTPDIQLQRTVKMNQHPPADHEGWMVSGRQKVLLGSSCLANHGSYIQLLFNYLPTSNLLTQLRLVDKWIITGHRVDGVLVGAGSLWSPFSWGLYRITGLLALPTRQRYCV